MAIINLFRNAADAVPFAAGQVIFSENEPGDFMYAVVDGEVEILSKGNVLETVGPGGIFGEMALIDHHHRSATAVARTDCRLVKVDEKRFQFLIQQTPFFALQVMRILAGRLRHTTDELGSG